MCNPARRWRPRGPEHRTGPVCGYELDGKRCRKRGTHYCEPRADRFVNFCSEILRHTAGPFARRRFDLVDWQEMEIARPLFGEVEWSHEWGRYVRRYRVAYIVMARKNGKSALAAAIVLFLLVGDQEESAEVYGAAKNTRQAGKVYQPTKRMVELSPLLSKRLEENKAARRLYDAKSASFYEVIPADALAELGHNPHGFVLDEVLSQPNGDLWNALRTADGTRVQALFLAITTETNIPESFGAQLIDEAERISEDPSRAPHIFAWVRKTPKELADADPFDEAIWHLANPALGQFKSLNAMRKLAAEAVDDPVKLEAFKQLQLNVRRSPVTRWMAAGIWAASAGPTFAEKDLYGRSCFGGLDLASTTDLAAWVLRFPAEGDLPPAVLWRFWTPEKQLRILDRHTGNAATRWVAGGHLVATEGDWIDYEGDPEGLGWSGTGLAIHPQIAADARKFRILGLGYDPYQATATAQYAQRIGLDIKNVRQGYGLSEALTEIYRMVKHDRDAIAKGEPILLGHGNHPVARYCAESAEVRRDDAERIMLVKPSDRTKAAARVDGMAALATALKVEFEYSNVSPPAPATAAADVDEDGNDPFRPTERLNL
ncbi:MAG: Phage terminase large subunit [Acidimicrobiales bacterium]|nr:Phage terminase large subunit [Acidimicrobiales bacterium]